MHRSRSFTNTIAGFVAALAIVVGTTGLSYGQDITDEHFKIAKQTVAASKSTQSLDRILPDLAERAKEQLIASRPDAADQISDIVDGAALSLAARRGDLEDEVARAYARIFTEAELKDILTFYTSETGKKLIEQTPVVARSIDQAARVWTNGIQRDLQQEVSKKLQEAGLQ